ncbi:MAG: hypothetical protein HYV02_06425 [Deltaproteobacteria bacterium]|nr:hypothetical protein [Deltaproteobacteria bacterium]
MRRGFLALAVMLMSGSVLAETTPILTNLQGGQFTGTIKSYVSKAIDGKKGDLTVKKTPEGTLMSFKLQGAAGQEREEWLVQGDTLIQREFDAAGKMTRTYTANIAPSRPMSAKEATFAIHCTDKAKNVCDAGIDNRNSWTITADANRVTYTVWGIEKKEDQVNPSAPVVKRHEFMFTTPSAK